MTDFYFKKKKKRNVVRTQLLDALFLPKEITASTRTEAISEILYTSHIPNASNVICPETMTKVRERKKSEFAKEYDKQPSRVSTLVSR